jgi:beta-phosphoglucomutase-like phosphatase (HAD superfamily)
VSARLGGARAALKALGVLGAVQQAVVYAERKQKWLEELIDLGGVTAFPGALRFVQSVGALGWPMAVASSSKEHQPADADDPTRLRPEPARYLQCQRLLSRFAAGQTERGDFLVGCRGAPS